MLENKNYKNMVSGNPMKHLNKIVKDEAQSNNTHPYVSEKKEGKPYAEWIVACLVVLCALLAFCGYTLIATVIISVTSIVIGIMRIILQKRSPWKVRSVLFDSVISIFLGVGLLITYFSITLFF